MHITRLRLAGFKSFVEPTDLLIEPGLTGVVGPNGCGKSNLLEALRWAMGEASHKSMRAAAMVDVIFAGTTTRPSRNHASVTLFIDNRARKAPAGFNDADVLEITRHIEREAGSAYRINGREARARDVKILFEDAATGARSPALVRQGQIAELVNAKPEQRRRILEDSAGTAGLSSRRHDAELRLRAAETNLARVADVLGGLGSQIASLKRQARAAARYREISAEIKAQEALASYQVWSQAHGEVAAEETALGEALALLAAATDGEARALLAEIAAVGRLPGLREAEVTQAAVVQRLRSEAEGLGREEARARERHADLMTRAVQLAADGARETAQAEEGRAAIETMQAERARLETEAATAEAETAAASAALDVARREEATAMASLAALTSGLAEKRAHRQRLDAQMADEQRRAARASAEIKTAADALARLEASPAIASHDETLARLEAAEAALAVQDDRIAAAERASASARAHEDRTRLIASERKVVAEKLLTERDTVARMLAPPKGASFQPVLDGLKVARGYEVALGAALGDDLDAPADPRAPAHWADMPGGDDPPLPEGTEPLAAKIKGAGPLARRLAQIGVVAKADGARLRVALKPGQRLVSREGDLWRWDGFTASAEAPSAAARRLEQRNRLDEIEAALGSAREDLEEAADDFAAAAAAREAATLHERGLREALRGLRADHAALAAQVAAEEKSAREQDGQRLLHGEAARRAEAAAAEHGERITALGAEIAALEDVDAFGQAQAAAQAQANRARSETGRAELALAGLASTQRQREQRLTFIASDLQRWATRMAAAASHIEALAARKAEAESQLADLDGEPARIAEARARLLTGIADAEAARQAAADALAEAETGSRAASKLLRDIQAQLSAAREGKARVETRLEAARNRRSAEASRIRETLGCAPEGVLALAGVSDPNPALPPAEDTQRRLQKLREDRDRLGGVNLAAEEELSGLEEKAATIEAEKADLEAAIAQLRQAIGKLTREGRKRLNDAFLAVNAHFQRLFTTLFGGGEARLEMIEDAEDPLAGGLEIIAKPPGKKPATLSLLSGGEQTLTALSLIFAVFLTNPSPICVLDEVDAPLDDSNVDRFCTLMEEMARSTETRFLVITHHPMTMARMDRLFGVTMAEKGVSQLVSVDLATAEQYREAG